MFVSVYILNFGHVLINFFSVNEFRVPVPDCNNEHVKGQQTFSFSVRAVNNNPLDPYNPYFGPWSVPGSVSCVLPGNFLSC